MAPATKPRKRIDPEERRQAIIDMAIVVIGERGFFGFTVQDLAQRCGLTNGGLLYHFKSKEEIFLAVLVEYERRMEAAMKPLTVQFAHEPRFGAPRARALAMLRRIVELSEAEPELMRLFAVVQAEALHRAHPAYDYFDKLQHRIVAGLGAIVEGTVAEPEAAARTLYALMIGLEYQWLRSDGAFDYLGEWDRAVAKILPDDAVIGER